MCSTRIVCRMNVSCHGCYLKWKGMTLKKKEKATTACQAKATLSMLYHRSFNGPLLIHVYHCRSKTVHKSDGFGGPLTLKASAHVLICTHQICAILLIHLANILSVLRFRSSANKGSHLLIEYQNSNVHGGVPESYSQLENAKGLINEHLEDDANIMLS